MPVSQCRDAWQAAGRSACRARPVRRMADPPGREGKGRRRARRRALRRPPRCGGRASLVPAGQRRGPARSQPGLRRSWAGPGSPPAQRSGPHRRGRRGSREHADPTVRADVGWDEEVQRAGSPADARAGASGERRGAIQRGPVGVQFAGRPGAGRPGRLHLPVEAAHAVGEGRGRAGLRAGRGRAKSRRDRDLRGRRGRRRSSPGRSRQGASVRGGYL